MSGIRRLKPLRERNPGRLEKRNARRGYLRRVEIRETRKATGFFGRVAGFLSKLFK